MSAARLHWLRSRNGRWHGWAHGARRSLCGTITAEDLRNQPAVELLPALPPEGWATLCRPCGKRAGKTFGWAPADGEGEVEREWRGWVARRVERTPGCGMGKHSQTDLARTLAAAGKPCDEAARGLADALYALLLGRRAAGVPAALALLRAPGAGEKVMAAVRAWRAAGGNGTAPRRPDVVIGVMLQVPRPAPYVRHLLGRGLTTMTAVFHPNTLARAKREPALRGLFAGAGDYWDKTLDQLIVIDD